MAERESDILITEWYIWCINESADTVSISACVRHIHTAVTTEYSVVFKNSSLLNYLYYSDPWTTIRYPHYQVVYLRHWWIYRHCKYLRMIDWLIIYGFTSHSRIFHLYGDFTIAGEGLQNLALCSALWAFEQGGIFIVPHLLWHGTSVFPVSSEGPPHLVAFYHTLGDVEDLF
jgi:hypothetical protein